MTPSATLPVMICSRTSQNGSQEPSDREMSSAASVETSSQSWPKTSVGKTP